MPAADTVKSSPAQQGIGCLEPEITAASMHPAFHPQSVQSPHTTRLS